MPLVYYNEVDPYCVAWLRELIAAGLLPEGDVDDRPVQEVRAGDLAGYRQCHFFAGIGGWAHACRLAGVADDAALWTGSPPCQDYSVAGAVWGVRAGSTGNRGALAHTWLDLIDAARPGTVLFENVPGIEPWLGEIEGRLAGLGYRLSRPLLAADAVGAPHPRRRVFLAAHRNGARLPLSGTPRPSTPQSDPWATAPRGAWRGDHAGTGGVDDGIPARVAKLRALGNAIVPQVAAGFIRASQDAEDARHA